MKCDQFQIPVVLSLAAFARRFEVEFLWDECLIFLRNDINEDNILRHYAKLRQKNLVELEETMFELCLDLLRKSGKDASNLMDDPHFRTLDHDARVHLKLALERGRRCLQVVYNKSQFLSIACCILLQFFFFAVPIRSISLENSDILS